MRSKIAKHDMKVVFVAKLGRLAKDKFHVIIPKQHNNKVKNLRGKQVRIILDDKLI